MLGSLPILPLPAPPSDGDLGPLPPAQLNPEDNDERMLENEEDKNKSVATQTRTIGIIYPPPDIRNIVDKTSQFVAKNGPEFEKRIMASNAGNMKFNFLTSSDPYHAYYQHRLSEARSQNQSSEPSQEGAVDSIADAAAEAKPDAEARPDPSAQFRPVRKVLEPPEAEQYTVRIPEGITGEELDIIKLTAQFVARNGKPFLSGLTSREMNNPQFHFLKPTHSMFMFFTSLADAYSKVLMPPTKLTEKLRNNVVDMTTVLERCLHRLEWERSQEQARQKAENEIEQERVQMAVIDWHDFVVVESIDFADDEDEELPPPMTLEEVIRRSKISNVEEEEIVEPGKEVEMEMDEEEVQLVEEGMRAASLEENGDRKIVEGRVIAEEDEAPMRIVKNWKRPEDRIPAERDPTKYVVSPITGELIPMSEMSEHMRISLIDPKYKEQKDRMFAKIKETTLAQDDEISRNIVTLAKTRPDIFGTTEEEVSNAVMAEIEKKKDEQPKQVIWDGHTASIGRTATQALSQNAVGEDQNDYMVNDARNLPGPAAPPHPLRPGVPSIRPLPPPPGLQLNMPRLPNVVQYSTPTGGGVLAPPPPRPSMVNMMPSVRPPGPPTQMMPGQQQFMVNRPQMHPSMMMNQQGIPVPAPPGSQFTPRPYAPQMSQTGMPMAPPPPMHQGIPPPPPPEEAPPPLPDEPELKKQKLDDSSLIPEDQFLAQHSGPARITIVVPHVDDLSLKGQTLEIMVQSLSETVAILKEKIAGETQLPSNKQKLSGKAGFLKDNLSLAYYNLTPGETLNLSLRERGGRKR
ncbi:hypothetical protein Leryth_000534 [Lithospermum erythrorhizon]|nr:hypothetical protein Leryth_000534 [Lithospermum erythrorhizon]